MTPVRPLVLVVALVALAFASAVVAGAAGYDPAPAPAQGRSVSLLRNEPGYRPLVDPESSAVGLGRRPNARIVQRPFTGGATSLDGLGRAICGALHGATRDSLLRLCVTDSEFREILWPEFPQSRPVTGVRWDDAWKILYARLHAGCSHAVRDEGGHVYTFVRFEDDSIMVYRNFRMHSRLVMVAKDDAGGVRRWTWLRAVVERRGRFKIYSTED